MHSIKFKESDSSQKKCSATLLTPTWKRLKNLADLLCKKISSYFSSPCFLHPSLDTPYGLQGNIFSVQDALVIEAMILAYLLFAVFSKYCSASF